MVEDQREIDVPGLERLMRSVLRTFFTRQLGEQWRDSLSGDTDRLIVEAAATARKARPNEALDDEWDAAGLREIAATIGDLVPRLVTDAALGVWEGPEYRTVDLRRIHAFRGKQLHGVGKPHDAHVLSEMAGAVLRLRTQFEALRRQLAGDDRQWWPYIESVHSNVSEFEWLRGQRMQGDAALRRPGSNVPTLREGDIVLLDVRAVHPSRGQGELRYAVAIGKGPPLGPTSPWTGDHQLQVEGPAGRNVRLAVFVADSGNDLSIYDAFDDVAHFTAEVIPARFSTGSDM